MNGMKKQGKAGEEVVTDIIGDLPKLKRCFPLQN